MTNLVNEEYLRGKVAEANRFVNAKEKYTTNGSSSDSTSDPPTGPFHYLHLDPPIPVDLKQIESICDPATKGSLKLLYESLCDKVQIMTSKCRKSYIRVLSLEAKTEEIVTMLLEAKKMKEELTKDNSAIIKAIIADRLE